MYIPKIIVESVTLDELKNGWAVYSIFSFKHACVVYVGLCKMSVLFALPDFHAVNAGAMAPDDSFALKMIAKVPDKATALRVQRESIRENEFPYLNQYGQARKARAGVRCVETGECWPSIQECARARGIDPAALSRHLRGVSGHATVKGMKYTVANSTESG